MRAINCKVVFYLKIYRRGKSFLPLVLEAMRENVVLKMTYKGYARKEPHVFDVQPYFIKIFRQRWYMAGFSLEKKQIRIYALDRIVALEETSDKFEYPKDFDAEDYMSGCFGIIRDDDIPIQHILLKVTGGQENYFRALPLHHSQEEVETTEEYGVFSYYLAPTFDFYQEILSHGNFVELLSPETVRNEMKQITQARCLYYMSEPKRVFVGYNYSNVKNFEGYDMGVKKYKRVDKDLKLLKMEFMLF